MLAELVGTQLLDADAGTEQGGRHRARRRADQQVGVAGVEPLHLLERAEGADHPRAAEHAAAAEDQTPPPGHRIVSRSSSSDSVTHWHSTSRSGIASRSALSP